MCKLGLVFLFSLLTGSTHAQGTFILLQSGNRQPFYVRLGTQLYSSTPSGHLILSQLKDSVYIISIGFPSQPGVGQSFSLAASHKDQELEIKDRGETGWGLYDAQTQEWLTVLSRSGGREEVRAIGVRRDDAFSRMMAGVVRDTAVLYNDYASIELATDSIAAARPASTVAIATPSTVVPGDTTTIAAISTPAASGADTPAVKPDIHIFKRSATGSQTASALKSDTAAATTLLFRPVAGAPEHRSPPVIDSSARDLLRRPARGIVKLSEKKLTRTMRLVYADKGAGVKSDTILVIIPLDTPQTVTAKNRNINSDSTRAPARPHNLNLDSTRITAKPRSPNPDSAGAHLIAATAISQPADKTRSNDSAKKPAAKAPLPYINSDCHNFATEYDVDKLRVKMLEVTKDDERIAAALKVFKTKCFSTRQIHALSEVFTTDVAKYRFFESAYPFAADEHFRELGALLTDPVFANKFKTLTGIR